LPRPEGGRGGVRVPSAMAKGAVSSWALNGWMPSAKGPIVWYEYEQNEGITYEGNHENHSVS